MRKTIGLFVFLLTFGAWVSAYAAHQSHSTATTSGAAMLADGTPVKLRVGASINLATVRVGDELDLDVEEEIRMNEVAVIPTSSFAKVVVMAQPPDAKAGKANISFRYVLLADGEKVALRPTREKKAAANRTVVSATESDVVIANGAEVTAYINGNLPLDLPKLRLANQPTNELKITTTPATAEVSVDGKILGTTPFTGRVVRGEHVVALRMAGFQPWRGTVRVTAEPANLQIALKKQDGLETIPQPVSQPPALGDLARAARAQKAAEGAPKAQGEPLELIPEEPKPVVDLGTPQTPALHPEPINPPVAKKDSADPAAAGTASPTAATPAPAPAATETAPAAPQSAATPSPALPGSGTQPASASAPAAQPNSSAAPAQPAAQPNASLQTNTSTSSNSPSQPNSSQSNPPSANSSQTSTPPANSASKADSGQPSNSAPQN